ncbi:MAG: DUF4476 domain-containing protein [Lacibacter sp.]
MRNSLLQRIFFIIIVFTAATQSVCAQLNHFIYLQTDNQQPFYIKYNNRIYSSSATGYLILSKLKEGPVEFTIGFPKSDQQEQQFKCVVDKADKGYLVKNFTDKGWGLFDLQTSVVLYASVPEITGNNTTVSTNQQPVTNDPFANMLSKVTQDSTVKNVTVKKEEKVVVPDPPKPVETEKPVVVVQQQPVVKDTVASKPVVAAPVVTEPVVQKEPEWTRPVKSAVIQVRKFDSKEGSDFVYEVAETGGVKDTVRLFIERDTAITAPVVTAPQTEAKPDTVAVVKEEKVNPVPEPQKKEEKKEEPVIKKEPQPEIKQDIPKTEEPKQPVGEQKQTAASLPNSNCKAIANEDDFMKLRRKMANESSDEAMISEAKKVLKAKCFSTAQLRNLAVLFLNDEGKYRFYDAAMLYVTDFSNFKSLSDTIQDEYYKKRFFALLPNQ